MRGTQPCPFDCIVKQKQKAKTNKKFHAFIWRTVDLLEINQGVHKRALTEPDTYPDDLKPFSNRQSSCFKARTFFTLEYVCISNPFLYPPVFGVLNCHPGKKILAIVIVSPLCLFFFFGVAVVFYFRVHPCTVRFKIRHALTKGFAADLRCRLGTLGNVPVPARERFETLPSYC